MTLLKAFEKEKPLYIPGFGNKLVYQFVRRFSAISSLQAYWNDISKTFNGWKRESEDAHDNIK